MPPPARLRRACLPQMRARTRPTAVQEQLGRVLRAHGGGTACAREPAGSRPSQSDVRRTEVASNRFAATRDARVSGPGEWPGLARWRTLRAVLATGHAKAPAGARHGFCAGGGCGPATCLGPGGLDALRQLSLTPLRYAAYSLARGARGRHAPRSHVVRSALVRRGAWRAPWRLVSQAGAAAREVHRRLVRFGSAPRRRSGRRASYTSAGGRRTSRPEALVRAGYHVLRLRAEQVMTDLPAAVARIRREIERPSASAAD